MADDDASWRAVALLALLGCLPYVFNIFKLILWLYRRTLRRRHDLIKRYGTATSDTPWAMVTGGSDGIGFAFCEELAEAGFNIMIVSRTRKKLEKALNDLQQRFDVAVSGIQIDLSTVHEDINGENDGSLRALRSAFRTRDVSIVVNNAGVSRRLPAHFHTITNEELKKMITINCTSVAAISKLALAHFRLRNHQRQRSEEAEESSERRRKGALVIISSVTAEVEAPEMSGYAATKAFDLQLARSLSLEYERHGVDVLAVTPAYVKTKLSGASRLGGFPPVVSARDCARGALDSLGYETVTQGHWLHDIQKALVSIVPNPLLKGEILDEMHRFRERKRTFLSSSPCSGTRRAESIAATSIERKIPHTARGDKQDHSFIVTADDMKANSDDADCIDYLDRTAKHHVLSGDEDELDDGQVDSKLLSSVA
eukprot:jgi/Bigna1/76993/fgenesh1_pg.45_\